MASGSGTQKELLELTQETNLFHEVIVTNYTPLSHHFLLPIPLRNVFNHFKLTPFVQRSNEMASGSRGVMDTKHTKHNIGTITHLLGYLRPLPYFNLIPAQMASGSGIHRELNYL